MQNLEVADNLPRLPVTAVGSGYALFLHRRSELLCFAFLRAQHDGWRCGGRYGQREAPRRPLSASA